MNIIEQTNKFFIKLIKLTLFIQDMKKENDIIQYIIKGNWINEN